MLVGIANERRELGGAEIIYGEEVAGREWGGQEGGGGGIESLVEFVDPL